MKNKETLEEVLKFPLIIEDGLEYLKLSRKIFEAGIRHQQEQDKNKYSEEDVRKAHSIGWITRERFDDLSPDIVYPKELDYEEKQDYAFNLWFEKFKKNRHE